MAEFESVHGDQLMPLGDRSTFVCVSQWRQEPLVHIRRYMKTEETEGEVAENGERQKLYPTKKGVCLNEQELDSLIAGLDKIKKKVKTLKKTISKRK